MERSIPTWIGAVLVFLALASVRERLGEPTPEAVLARARGLRVERDPRRMCARELRQLPGVGERLALAIARARDAPRGPLALAWEDVPGIGEARAREIRAWCRARGVEPDPLRPGAGIPASAGYALVMPALARILPPGVLALLAACGSAADGSRDDPEAGASAAPETPNEASSNEASNEASSMEQLRAPRPRTLALQGGALHALEAGPPEGALVLLLHGARFSAHTWEELGTLARLGEAGLHALAIDWPGYGATPRWSSEPDAATLLASVCDELGAERAALVGASLGGGFALEFARRSPGRVSALVAIAPAGAQSLAPEVWSTPTLLVWGDEDDVVPLEVGRALAERLPGARLEVFAGAGHPCYLDQPERFHDLLLEFLRTR